MRTRAYFPEFAISSAVALLGFGALALIYAADDWKVPPGLLYFQSATWGDGILLPFAAGLQLHLCRSTPSQRSDVRSFAAFAAVGAVVGGIVIWRWLAEPSPVLNWTLPEPGRFNRAGRFHAAFLVLTSGLLAGRFGLFLVRLRRLQANGRVLASPAWILCLRGVLPAKVDGIRHEL